MRRWNRKWATDGEGHDCHFRNVESVFSKAQDGRRRRSASSHLCPLLKPLSLEWLVILAEVMAMGWFGCEEMQKRAEGRADCSVVRLFKVLSRCICLKVLWSDRERAKKIMELLRPRSVSVLIKFSTPRDGVQLMSTRCWDHVGH